MKSFEELGISTAILQAIGDLGFSEPTEIQRESIPLILAGQDVFGGSATGSGKTLAFGCGIIQNAVKGGGVQALILTPTRELCEQVAKAMQSFAKYNHLNVTAIYGGVGINPQMHELEHSEVVVGTPGRILDHLQRRTANFSKVKTLVLDEADRMLDMGFLPDVEKIIRQCPRERQTLLFSATISDDVYGLAQRHMNDPAKISVGREVDPKKLLQVYYDVPDKLKYSLLVHLLKKEESGLVMIFCNSRKNVDFVAKNLKLEGIPALAIHGGYSQARRNKIMEQFHDKKANVLVCTDVAARGLHIEDVSHVYNYDIPKDHKEYVHRIGRTARAGSAGKAINILASRDHDNFSRILRALDVTITKEQMPAVQRVMIKWKEESRGRQGGRSGYGQKPRRSTRTY
jgi:ATP-dependent RNA helicase DeaD